MHTAEILTMAAKIVQSSHQKRLERKPLVMSLRITNMSGIATRPTFISTIRQPLLTSPSSEKATAEDAMLLDYDIVAHMDQCQRNDSRSQSRPTYVGSPCSKCSTASKQHRDVVHGIANARAVDGDGLSISHVSWRASITYDVVRYRNEHGTRGKGDPRPFLPQKAMIAAGREELAATSRRSFKKGSGSTARDP